jgi:hypothetical protein
MKMANGRKFSRALRSTLANRPMIRWLALALLAATPITVYAAAVTGLTTFVNGTIADADQMNANFSTVGTAVDDNHVRINTLEAIPDQQCASGDYATGIDASGNLLCAAPPAPPSTSIVSTPLPNPWLGNTITTPECPTGSIVVAGAVGSAPGTGICSLSNGGGSSVLQALVIQGADAISCIAALTDLQGGTPALGVNNCACLAICQSP